MTKAGKLAAGCLVFLAMHAVASAEDIRLLNGVVIRGEARKATNEGLEVLTPQGPKTYAWNTLSAATRYRYQVQYRANLKEILQGQPVSARTNLSDPNFKPIAEPTVKN